MELFKLKKEIVIVMKTAVIGFPRIGELRELKFELEKYFRKEIGANQLLSTSAEALEIAEGCGD